ncbi:MAG: NAD(P)H-dependent oxidoreductase [Bacillota bacterium]
MPEILIVYHSLSGNTEEAAMCVAEGAGGVQDAVVVVKPASEAGPEDLMSCDGIAIGTPDYFSYMAGMVKDFFDRAYYPTRGKVDGKPCIAFVSHGGGGRADASVEAMCKSFRFRMLAPPVSVVKSPDQREREELRDAGRLLARACVEAAEAGEQWRS